MDNAKQYILSLVGAAPIAFYRPFADLAGSATGGLFFSQLMYWSGKGVDEEGWIFKTQHEWEEETFLTRSEQESARKALRKIGVLEEKKKGTPARLYYKINFENLHKWLQRKAIGSQQTLGSTRMQKTAIKDAKFSKQACDNQQSSKQDSASNNAKNNKLYTETTTKNTQRKQQQQLPRPELIFPDGISIEEKENIFEKLLGIPFEFHQQILDELAGAIKTKAIKRGVIPYCLSLISAAKSDKFTPSLCIQVRAARRKSTEAHDQELLTVQHKLYEFDHLGVDSQYCHYCRSRFFDLRNTAGCP